MHRAKDGAITLFLPVTACTTALSSTRRPECGAGTTKAIGGQVCLSRKPDFSGHLRVWSGTSMSSFGNALYLPRILLDDLWNKPAFHLPHGMIRSCAEPVFDTTNGKFGPFAGQMLMADQSGDQIIRCMPEKVDGAFQGAAIHFFKGNGLRRGNNRLAFSPEGDVLYIGQTGRGWGSLSEGIQRIRFTGETPFSLLNCSLTQEGFDLTHRPLTRRACLPDNLAERYRYAYGYKYGGERSKTLINPQGSGRRDDPRSLSDPP